MRPRISAGVTAAIYWLLLVIPATAWETSGFRTARGKLIHTGMLQTEVLSDAGQPLDRHAATTSKNDSKPKGKREVWTYRGTDGLYALTFQDRRLTKIEVKPARDF